MTFTISEFWLGLIAGNFSCIFGLIMLGGISAFFYNRSQAKAENRRQEFAEQVKTDAKKMNEKQMGSARNGQP